MKTGDRQRESGPVSAKTDTAAARRRLFPGRRADPPVLTLATAADAPESSPDPPRRLRAEYFWLLVAVAGIVSVIALLASNLPSAPGPPPNIVVASMPYWNIDQGTTAVVTNRANITEVSPWMYGLDADGNIINQYPDSVSGTVTADISRMRAQGLRLVPTLANVIDGDFAYQPVAAILHDPVRAAAHIRAIVGLVVSHDYAGIDIDYEDLLDGDRQVFTSFLTDLASALHQVGKVLSVALFAKASNAGYDQRNVAQDYHAIGAVADEVRLMGYDYHWETSPPGPVAPVDWIQQVLRYAVTQIPASKIILGIPEYGYDWVGDQGTPITWLQAFQLANQYHATTHYDTTSQTPWFTYTDAGGQQHTVWFENAASSAAKLGVARAEGIRGVYLWLYGSEDIGVWASVHKNFPVTATGSSTTASGGTQ